MKYFDGIKVNDRVWDLVNLWGVVSKICDILNSGRFNLKGE